MFAAAREPKRLFVHQGGHFDTYTAHFAETNEPARAWFAEHRRAAQPDEPAARAPEASSPAKRRKIHGAGPASGIIRRVVDQPGNFAFKPTLTGVNVVLRPFNLDQDAARSTRCLRTPGMRSIKKATADASKYSLPGGFTASGQPGGRYASSIA